MLRNLSLVLVLTLSISSISAVASEKEAVLFSGDHADALKLQTTANTSFDSAKRLDIRSLIYDYDLYFADPETAQAWYLEWTYEDGDVLTTGPHRSYDSAYDHLLFMLFGGYDPRDTLARGDSYPDVRIVEGDAEPHWQLLGTFDTKSEAQDIAAWLQAAGLLTEIRPRSVLLTP